jgi:drug/metabolite transporter (DMT)-like permease
MKTLTEQRTGEWIISLEVFLWSFFPVITVLSYGTVPSLLALAWSSLFACFFFIPIMAFRKKWHEAKNLLLWKYVLVITLFNSVAFYVLYFTALKYTTPGNAAIISLLEILTSFVFFNIILREEISREYLAGACLMLIGALIVLAPNFAGINIGDFLILATTLVAPMGNLYQQKARKLASGETVVFLRSILATPIIFFLAYLFGQHASVADVRASLLFLLINGVLLLGLSKLLWVEGIHRMSVTKAMALQGAGPVLTLLIAWMLLSQTPTMWQLVSLAPLLLGVLLLTDQFRLSRITQPVRS